MTEVSCPRPCPGRQCRRVSRFGTVYRCAQALANELGVTRNAIYQSLYRHGDAEHAGAPRGGRRNNRRPIKVGVHYWDSITALARDLGMDRSHIGKTIQNDPQALLALVMRHKK